MIASAFARVNHMICDWRFYQERYHMRGSRYFLILNSVSLVCANTGAKGSKTGTTNAPRKVHTRSKTQLKLSSSSDRNPRTAAGPSRVYEEHSKSNEKVLKADEAQDPERLEEFND
jgi:hypothetical protein